MACVGEDALKRDGPELSHDLSGRANATPISIKSHVGVASRERSHDRGLVTAGPVGCDAEPCPLSVS